MAYHHGDLRAAILQAAADAVRREGPHAVNLRALAREVGVSHTAPRHHFGDKRGVLTALATQGYVELTGRLAAAGARGDFLDVGVAFVAYALERPAHFQMLFRPDLVDTQDPDLRRARSELSVRLTGGAERFASGSASGQQRHPADDAALTEAGTSGDHLPTTALAAWSMAHGFATLALSGALTVPPGGDLLDLARRTLSHLSRD
ncbi:MAG: WHG domain-containing protein [Actinobacteria bacterium]|nr:WHG domain-containing protein [Actinomycetota bacterium]